MITLDTDDEDEGDNDADDTKEHTSCCKMKMNT